MSVPLRVLIVADRPAEAAALLHALEQAGFACAWQQVETEEGFLTALDPGLDVILAAYRLPGFGAERALALLRERGLDIPCLAIAGRVGEEAAVACMKQGAADVVLTDALARLGAAVAQAVAARQPGAARRREGAASADERRFRAIVEYSADALLLVDADGVILFASPSAGHVLGYDEEALLGRPAADLAHPDDLPAATEQFQRLYREPEVVVRAEGRVRRGDGEWRWMEVVGRNLLAHPDVRALVINFRDITERKRTEEALAERARLAAFTAAVGLALTRGADLRESLQGCAEAMVHHLGAALARLWTLNEAQQVLELQASAGLSTRIDGSHRRVPVGAYEIGRIAEQRRPYLTNAVLGDPQIHDQAWAEREGMVAFAGHPLQVGERLVGVMGLFARRPLSPVTLEALATVADMVALAIERKRTEAALLESEVRFRAIFEAAAIGVARFELERRDWECPPGGEQPAGAAPPSPARIVEWNPAFEQLLGYEAEELRALSLSTLVLPDPDTLAAMAAGLADLVAGRRRHATCELRYRRRGGEVRWAVPPSRWCATRQGGSWAASCCWRTSPPARRRSGSASYSRGLKSCGRWGRWRVGLPTT